MTSEEGMVIFLPTLLDVLQKQMKVLEQDIQNEPRELIPEFSEQFGWFLHTTSVGVIPLTKYCLFQSIYMKVYEKHFQSSEIAICDIMKEFTNEQLEELLSVIFS